MKNKSIIIGLIWGLSIGTFFLSWASKPSHSRIILRSPDTVKTIALESADTLYLQEYKSASDLVSKKCVNLNNASADELDALPGIGKTLAQQIIQFRQKNGSFQNIDDLGKVKGIGNAKLAQLRQNVCL